MTASILDLGRERTKLERLNKLLGINCDVEIRAVDRAIARADLVAKLKRCRLAIDLLKRRHVDELNAAAIDLANAHDELEAFTRGEGRAS